MERLKRQGRHDRGETRSWVGAEVMGNTREQLLSGRPGWAAPGQWLGHLGGVSELLVQLARPHFLGETEGQGKSPRLRFPCSQCATLLTPLSQDKLFGAWEDAGAAAELSGPLHVP